MTGRCLPTAWINIIPEMQLLIYKFKERRGSFSRYAKVQASKLSCTSKRKKKKASKPNRHLNKMHTITLYCLPDLNKENTWDWEILLSASVLKGGDGMGWDMYCCHCAWPVSDSQPFATVGWNSQLPGFVQASPASARLPCSLGRQ